MRQFEAWLRRHRGIAESSVRRHSCNAGRLAADLGPDAGTYSTAAIRETLLRHYAGVSGSQARCPAGSMRMYLRFLASTGACAPSLLHRRSSEVDGHYEFDVPNLGVEISLGDLFSRTPDLRWDYTTVSEPLYANVSECAHSAENGLTVKLIGDRAPTVACIYEGLGYAVAQDGKYHSIRCGPPILLKEPPMFVHTYVHKMMGAIPGLRLAAPFGGGARFSQLCITFIMSYALGMLARYYPTHWIALINGGQGDLLWPTVNRAQHHVENIFPELVSEYVAFAMDNPGWVASACTNDA